MDSTLLVIGLNHRTAPLAMRERFWISETRRYAVLRQLSRAEGVEEVIVLTTSSRTEFLIWASEPMLAANSVLNFLGVEHGLKLSEWEHFYRLIAEDALAHIFRVACGLDSPVLGEPEVSSQLKTAWEQSRAVGGTHRVLDAVVEKALNLSEGLRKTITVGASGDTISTAVVNLARDVFAQLKEKRVLLLGISQSSQKVARDLQQSGAGPVCVIDQSVELSQNLARELCGTSATLADRWQHIADADIVLCGSGCPHVILTRTEAETIVRERQGAPLVIVDLAMPRDVDPGVRRVDGIVLCDLEGLERVAKQNANDHANGQLIDRNAASVAEAEKIVLAEAQAFSSKLQAEGVVSTIVALHQRLDEIRRQDLESFIKERGPFTKEQDQALHAITAQLVQKIASFLARELKDLPEQRERERMTAAVQRLFHLKAPKAALAGTKSETSQHEQRSDRKAIAINS